VPFFGAFGAAWDDAMVARWSADPLGMLWPERERDVCDVGWRGPADYCAAAGGHHRCGVDIGEARQPLYGAKLTAATTRLSSSFDTSSGQASRRGLRDSPLRTIENL
jgi:hypothetical protein